VRREEDAGENSVHAEDGKDAEELRPGFDPESIVRKIITTSAPETISKDIEREITAALTVQADSLKTQSPDKFSLLLKGNEIFQSFVVTGTRALIQGYEVHMGVVSVSLDETIECAAGTADCPTRRIVPLGNKGQIEAFKVMRPDLAKDWSPDYAGLSEFLIGLTVSFNPTDTREALKEQAHALLQSPTCENFCEMLPLRLD
jgi:hypothetical protein